MKKLIQDRFMIECNDTKYNHLDEFSVSIGSSIGQVRKANEDRVLFAKVNSPYQGGTLFILAVSDGMGGMKNGSLASAITVSSFLLKFKELESLNDIQDRIAKSINYANTEVYKKLGGEGGATFSLLIFNDSSECYYSNIGDSRIYQAYKSSGLTQLTIDDDVQNLLKREGLSVDGSILNQHGITKFIGMDSELEIDIVKTIASGTFILASDGTYRIGNKLMAVLYSHSESVSVFIERVITTSNWMGGVDNSSCIAIDFETLSKNIFEITDTNKDLTIWDPMGAYVFSLMTEENNKSFIENKKKVRSNKSKKAKGKDSVDSESYLKTSIFDLKSDESENKNDF
jgi:serine/threonine protein phosphatase PrpC